jgi:zinc transport system substrate-binding protein
MQITKKAALIVIVVAMFAVVATLMMVALERPAISPANGKISVVTTLFPFYDFARQIGGDKAEVTLLLPPGVEPHSFDPRPSDIVKINQADVFIFTGKFMEPWAADLVASLPSSVAVVDASKGIDLQPSNFHDADEPAGAPDPHIWLDFGNDTTIVGNIVSAFVSKDPGNASYYRANAEAYDDKLAALDSEFRAGLALCVKRELVYGGHYALGYLARRYGLSYSAAQGVSPDAEPTVQDIASLVAQIRRDKIEYVFYEELSSPKIAQTIAQEAGAKMLLMNAGHNISKEELRKGTDFIAIMKVDLANLKIGLQCRGR